MNGREVGGEFLVRNATHYLPGEYERSGYNVASPTGQKFAAESPFGNTVYGS